MAGHLVLWAAIPFVCAALAQTLYAAPSFAPQINSVQPRIVKIYGAGGVRGLEAYQSGFLVSADGHVLTVWSYVLDTEYLSVTLDDGRKFDADFIGADPKLEIAVLKLKNAADLPHFDLNAAAAGEVGNRVLAFSNLYGVAAGSEAASVQRGVISAVTNLTARKGVFKTPYDGPVYVVDAMTNNPGAPGGALTNQQGQLLAMIGKELRNADDNSWLNYAVPIAELRDAVAEIIAGKSRPRGTDSDNLPDKPVDLVALGIVLVPEVVDSTPPFIDSVRTGSPAAAAGLRRDDLILFVDSALVQSLDELKEKCRRIEAGQPLRLTVRRGDEFKVIALDTTVMETDQ
jgi:serine protease Do